MSLEDEYQHLGLEQLNNFIDNEQEEHLHLEFKTINSSDLDRDDRKNLAITVSGFANSDGGLIVWGIEARKNANGVDCASGKQEIDSLRHFITRLNSLTGQAISPIVDGIQHKAIPANGDNGFAVTIVPQSDTGPHMAMFGEYRYYKRSGDSFYRMEHFDLEDMFGRRRRPRLSLLPELVGSSNLSGRFGASLHILISIENSGRGTAKAPYIILEFPEHSEVDGVGTQGSTYGDLGLPLIPHHTGGEREFHFGNDANKVIHPSAILQVCIAKIPILYSIEQEHPVIFTFRGQLGAEDIRPVDFEKDVRITHDEYMAMLVSERRRR